MTETDMAGLHEAIGRVIVPAAKFEVALATIAYAALGGDATANAKTHAMPPSQLKIIIQAEAHGQQWWCQPVLALLSRSDEPLAARHRVVHGDWTDVRGIHGGHSFVTFKPDRKSKQWHAQFFDLDGLAFLAEQLEALHREARQLADRMVDELPTTHNSAGTQPGPD